MSYADVCEAVESLQRKYCERDPFRLCADMGIKLLYQLVSLPLHYPELKVEQLNRNPKFGSRREKCCISV